MKQLELMQYVQDYDNFYPAPAYSGSPFTYGRRWGGALFPYVKSAQIYRCPSDKSTAATPFSYAINGQMCGSLGAANNEAKLRATAKTIALIEVFERRSEFQDFSRGFPHRRAPTFLVEITKTPP